MACGLIVYESLRFIKKCRTLSTCLGSSFEPLFWKPNDYVNTKYYASLVAETVAETVVGIVAKNDLCALARKSP
ncbi:MAG: hypothetical protein ACI9NY_001218 [Kiritimatiellia bacterium]|jgi:hypothetical protein